MCVFGERGCFFSYLGMLEFAKVFHLGEKRGFLGIRGAVFWGICSSGVSTASATGVKGLFCGPLFCNGVLVGW